MTSYAIVRYRLMDIRVAVTSAGLFMAVYLITLGVPFYVYKAGYHFSALVLAILLATIAPVIYARLRKRAEDSLLREERAYQAAIREAIQALGRFKEVGEVSRFLVELFVKAVRTRSAAFYEFDGARYLLRDVSGDGGGYVPEMAGDMPMAPLFKASRGALALEELRSDVGGRDAALERFLQAHPAAVAVPVRRGDTVLGVIFLGDKLSGAAFTPGDLDVLSAVVEPAALAIENARFLQDIRSAQEQLFEAQKMATIGFLVGGLSHQLRNRFSALLFYADFAARNIADRRGALLPEAVCDETLGHLGKITSGIDSSKEVLNGILNYTAGRETRAAISLKKLVASSVEFAGFKIPAGSVVFEDAIAEDIPPVLGNLAQLQEVLFNIIDNAYHSMQERQAQSLTGAGGAGYGPQVVFSAACAGDMVVLTVTDNGMGIREEDMGRLSAPLFSTKRSGGKGHGLGLYMMRQIVEKNHGGRIVLSSEYGKGVTVDISLPAAG